MMGQGSEFRGLSQSVVGKEMRMRVEHSFRSFGCEGEGGRGGGRERGGKRERGTWSSGTQKAVFCHQINRMGRS